MWRSQEELAQRLAFALQQPGCSASHAYIQELIEFDFEMRLCATLFTSFRVSSFNVSGFAQGCLA